MGDGFPEFKSALEFTTVRDFAYQKLHPLHYGAPIPPDPRDEQEDDGWEVHQKFDLAGLEEDPDGYYYDGDDIFCRAVALFAFEAENDNEIGLVEGQTIWVSCRHGQGWLLAENLETGQTGLVPEEYVQLIPDEDEPTQAQHADNADSAHSADSTPFGTPFGSRAGSPVGSASPGGSPAGTPAISSLRIS